MSKERTPSATLIQFTVSDGALFGSSEPPSVQFRGVVGYCSGNLGRGGLKGPDQLRYRIETRPEVETPVRARSAQPRDERADLASRLLELQRTVGNRATNSMVQRSLVVGRADDPAERAADTLADLVLHDGKGPVLPADGSSHVRQSATTAADTLGGATASEEVVSHLQGARGTGHDVPEAIRRRVRPVLGDVSAVRVHDDPQSHELSTALEAKAFTVGRDIFFAKGQLRPGTSAGDHLLVHELAHTAQQRDGLVRRRANFDGKRLKGLTTFKGWFNNSSFNQIVDTYADYNQVADHDAPKELWLLAHLDGLLDQWATQRNREGANKRADLSPEDQQKADVLSDLLKAVKAELPLVRVRAQRQKLVTDLGIPPAYAGEMTAADVSTLVGIDRDLGQGNIGPADAALTGLRPSLGDGPVNLIRSMLMRKHIGRVNAAMANVLDDPKYALSDPNAITTGAGKAQQFATQRIADIDTEARKYPMGKPSTMDDAQWLKIDVKLQEGKLQKPVLADLGGSAAAKRAAPDTKKALGKLTDEEVSAILGYSTNLYGKYNAPLRGDVGQLPADQQALTQLAVSALNKLKAHTDIVYRHGANFPGYAKLNRAGAVVVDMAFLSTAREQKGCVSAAESHEVLEVIKSRSGRDISQLSAFGKGEAEVLFRPGTRFRVTSVVQRDGTGAWPDDVTERYANETTKKDSIQLVVYKEEV